MTKNNNNNKEPKKYQIENYLTTNIDQIENCKDRHVICPDCNNVGHMVRHLNSSKKDLKRHKIEVKIGVNHGHFLLDKKTKEPKSDEGRNVTHYTKQKMISIRKYCKIRYTLKTKKSLPPWLCKRLQDEYGL